MRYRVLQPLTLHPGALLGLTAAQAAARSFGLVPQGVQWLVVKPVGFKAGETVEVDQLPKAHANAVQALPAEPRKPAAKRAQAAQATPAPPSTLPYWPAGQTAQA